MKPVSFFIFLNILLVFLLIDLYTLRGIRLLTANWSSSISQGLQIVHILIYCYVLIITLIVFFNQHRLFSSNLYYGMVYPFMGIVTTVYLSKLIFNLFLLITDIFRLIKLIQSDWILLEKLSLYFLNLGAVLAIVLLLSMAYGIAFGRFQYKVKEIEFIHSKIPKEFNGFKIIHISDWHLGSFKKYPRHVKRAVEIINQQKADIILFTGDIVNNIADELQPYISILNELHSTYGKFAVLGNHDYGEYVNWQTEMEEENNLKMLERHIQKSGFTLLNNSNTNISRYKNKIQIVGVENWGLPPFPQKGDILQAMENIDTSVFTILMSHDPSHWKEEVLKKTKIDLTLSGHTHGMQFGIELPWLKWSPVKWKYEEWGGMYHYNDRYLYVNQGVGFIGFPGRVGIRPEIAVIQLINEK